MKNRLTQQVISTGTDNEKHIAEMQTGWRGKRKIEKYIREEERRRQGGEMRIWTGYGKSPNFQFISPHSLLLKNREIYILSTQKCCDCMFSLKYISLTESWAPAFCDRKRRKESVSYGGRESLQKCRFFKNSVWSHTHTHKRVTSVWSLSMLALFFFPPQLTTKALTPNVFTKFFF